MIRNCTILSTHIAFTPDTYAEMSHMFGVKNESDSRAFPILAGYIFGKNKDERKLR